MSEPTLHALDNNRGALDGEGTHHASLNLHRVLFRIIGKATKHIVSAICENQSYRFGEALSSLSPANWYSSRRPELIEAPTVRLPPNAVQICWLHERPCSDFE